MKINKLLSYFILFFITISVSNSIVYLDDNELVFNDSTYLNFDEDINEDNGLINNSYSNFDMLINNETQLFNNSLNNLSYYYINCSNLISENKLKNNNNDNLIIIILLIISIIEFLYILLFKKN